MGTNTENKILRRILKNEGFIEDPLSNHLVFQTSRNFINDFQRIKNLLEPLTDLQVIEN